MAAAGGAMAGAGSIIGAAITANAMRDQAKTQAEALQKIYRWGYGYPDWLLKAIQGQVTGAEEGFDPYTQQMLEEMGPEAYEQYLEIDRMIDALKARPDTQGLYQQMAKASWGQGSRALEEVGLKGGALERGRTTMSDNLARALLQASQTGEQESWNRQLQIAGLSQTAASMLPGVSGLFSTPEQQYQAMLSQAIATATGIPGYQYQPPQIPNMGSFMGPAIASGFSDVGQALAYNYGMQQPTTSYGYSTSPQYTGYGSYYGQGTPAQRSNQYSPYSTYGVYD